jgi:hypothetical protein
MFQDKLTREIAAAAAQIKTEPPKNEVNTKSVEGAVMSIMTNEELKGNQHKIDANKNGKVDAHDFKLLRAKKGKEMQEGVKGAGLGAAVGSVAGGPVGAAIGGALGHVAGEVLSSAKNKAKAMGRIAVGPSMADSKMKREDVEQFRKDKEMQEGVKGAGLGAAVGSVAGGPVGAAIGGALGHVAGEVLSSAKNKAKAMGRIAVGPSMADSKLKKEDIEQLDEIGDTKEGRKMISSYVNKALGDKNREKGLRKATSRLYKDNYYGKKTNEEVEMNEEDAYNKDRYAVKDGKAKKDNPTHMGSPNYKDQPHHVWATSAEHALKKSMKKEEVEQLDEAFPTVADAKKRMAAKESGFEKKKISTGTVYSRKYKAEPEDNEEMPKKKAKTMKEMLSIYSTGGAEALVENLMIEEPSQDEYKKEVEVAHAKAEGKIRNDKGIAKAAAQGVKMEEVEIEVLDADEINGVQIDNIEERSLTDTEMNKREEIVKSMKKGIQGFKDRYGDKAKNVMYATAAKIAKEKA